MPVCFFINCLLMAATTTLVSGLELPDTSGIDGQLTANLGVDHFFSLWLVFSNDDVKMSGEYILYIYRIINPF